MKFLESTWEQHFISESQLLEEMLSRGDIKAHGSRLQIAIENNILDWNRYSGWAQDAYELPLLKRGLYKDQIAEMKQKIEETKQILGDKFDSDILDQLKAIPFCEWDGTFFLLALEPLPRMIELKFDFLLVLAPPEIITVLSDSARLESTTTKAQTLSSREHTTTKIPQAPNIDSTLVVDSPPLTQDANGAKVLSPPKIQGPFLDPMAMSQGNTEEEDEKPSSKKKSSTSESKKDHSEAEDKETPLEISMDSKVADDVDFGALLSAVVQQSGVKETKTSAAKPTASPKAKSEISPNEMKLVDPENYWKKVDTDHENMSATARRNFDGYVVLRLVGNQTSLFKMDEELEKENLSPALFAFNVETQTFFRDCLRSRKTDSTSFKKLELSILDFNYLCATPLFLGDRPIGFILGFKVDKLNEQDEVALQKISESA